MLRTFLGRRARLVELTDEDRELIDCLVRRAGGGTHLDGEAKVSLLARRTHELQLEEQLRAQLRTLVLLHQRPTQHSHDWYKIWRSAVAEWSNSVDFKAGVSQRRFESGRRQTVTVTARTLWQGSLNLSATSPMTTKDAETDVKLNIIIIIIINCSMDRYDVRKCATK